MKFFKYISLPVLAAAALMIQSCSDVDIPETPSAGNPVAAVQYSYQGRKVTLSWDAVDGATGYQVLRDGTLLTTLAPSVTTYQVKGVPTGTDTYFTVKAVYGDMVSSGTTTVVNLPAIPQSWVMFIPEDNVANLTDDDEIAAADWFKANYIDQNKGKFVYAADLADLDPDTYQVMWIMVDRVGQPAGWENLPGKLGDQTTIDLLKTYSADGGALYLSNMATQLTEPLGMVVEGEGPTIFGNGGGGSGTDVWVLNAFLGWDFRDGGDQGFYDRTGHAIYQGLTFEDPNGYGYDNLPLIGPGHREDHNCMWDCNIYGKGSEPDVIRNFEVTNNCLVLATWGHVRDHCVAAIVDFSATPAHGKCVANGLAAYEFNQNSGVNIYQKNIEQLTANILNYLQ